MAFDEVYFRSYLENVLDRYLRAEQPVHVKEYSTEPPADRLSASKVYGCPLYHAELAKGNIEKAPLDPRSLMKTEQGKWWGNKYQEALLWAQHQDQPGLFWFERECEGKIGEHTVHGTVDALMFGHGGPAIPIEVKNSSGLWQGQVIQLATYMAILNVPLGYLVIINDTVTAHRVRYNSVNDTFEILDDAWVAIPVVNDLPGNPFTGANEFPHAELERLVQKHVDYRTIEETRPPYTEPNFRCAHIVPADYYKRNYTDKLGQKWQAGDLKPGTGIITPKCPLYERCWGGIGNVRTSEKSE